MWKTWEPDIVTMHTVRGPITSQKTHHTKVTKDDIFFHEEFLLDFSNTQPRTEDIPKLLFLGHHHFIKIIVEKVQTCKVNI